MKKKTLVQLPYLFCGSLTTQDPSFCETHTGPQAVYTELVWEAHTVSSSQASWNALTPAGHLLPWKQLS